MARIKILSLDGGGALAGILALALGRIYGASTRGRDIIKDFDVVVGNSGGSIVLTALCCNYTPRDIASFYADPATVRRMFSPRWSEVFKSILPLRLLFPPYSSTGKFAALKALFDGNRQPGEPLPSEIRLTDWPKLLQARTNLVVTAYDYDRERAAFFRSNDASPAMSSASHASVTLAEAVHASTNAPIFAFDEPAECKGRRYWDGGLAGYNNPVLAGVVEAMANFPSRNDDMRVLSIGTGVVTQALTSDGAAEPLGAKPASTCVAAALRKAGTAIIADPPGAATFHAYVALGQPLPKRGEPAPADTHLVRLCPFVRPCWNAKTGEWDLPAGLTSKEFRALVDLPTDAMTAPELALIEKMGNLWVDDKIANQPVRIGERMRCDVGDETFSAAVEHWRRVEAEENRP